MMLQKKETEDGFIDKTISYTLKIKPGKIKNIKSYIGFLRYLILKNEYRLVPLTMEPVDQKENILKNLMNPQILAQRVGLLSFDCYDIKTKIIIKDIKKVKTEPFYYKNETSETQWLKSKDLVFKSTCGLYEIAPTFKEDLICKIPSMKEISFKITLQQRTGQENAAYSKIEGFRLNESKKDEAVDSYDLSLELENGKLQEILEKIKVQIGCLSEKIETDSNF